MLLPYPSHRLCLPVTQGLLTSGGGGQGDCAHLAHLQSASAQFLGLGQDIYVPALCLAVGDVIICP